MKDFFVKNFHWLIIAWALQGIYVSYTEHEEMLLPVLESKPGIEETIVRLERQLKEIETFKKNLEQMKERLSEVRNQIEKLQRQLPSDVNDTVVLTFLSDEGKKINILNGQYSPSAESNNGFYIAKDYKMAAEGTFLQFLIMFEKIAASERILNIKNFNMTADRTNNRGFHQIIKMEASIESFRYNTNYVEDSGAQAIEEKYKI